MYADDDDYYHDDSLYRKGKERNDLSHITYITRLNRLLTWFINNNLIVKNSLSPDMICREHDLSIYTANFQESCSTLSDKKSSIIWEGQGLLSWIMDAPPQDESGDLTIHGKTSNAKDTCEVHIELQPVSFYNYSYNCLSSLSRYIYIYIYL